MNRKGKRRALKQNKELEKARSKEILRGNEEVLRLTAYPLEFENDEERVPHLEELLERNRNGEVLNGKEIEFLCFNLTLEEKVNHNICDDHRFYDLYLDHIFIKNGMPFSDAITRQQRAYLFETRYNPEAISRRENELAEFYEGWKEKIENTEQSADTLYIEIRKEAKKMIRQLRESLTTEGLTEDEIIDREKEIIYRSKAIYIKAKETFMYLGKNRADLFLCGKEVHIDEFTLVHILFRHFAEVTKQFDDNKSHFTPEIRVETLIIKIKDILEKIDRSKYLGGEMPQDIFFKYYGRLYRIYFKYVNKSEAGRGNYSVQRVNTFYPVEVQKDLDDSKKRTPRKVDKWLQVFV